MSHEPTDRRLVLRRLGQAGFALGATGALGALGYFGAGRFRARPAGRAIPDHRVPDEPSRPTIVAARGSDPAAMVRAALAALGGIERFVRRGETVLVKPNMAWDRSPSRVRTPTRRWWPRSCASAGPRARGG